MSIMNSLSVISITSTCVGWTLSGIDMEYLTVRLWIGFKCIMRMTIIPMTILAGVLPMFRIDSDIFVHIN